MFENRESRTVFGSRRHEITNWRKLHNDEFQNLWSFNVVGVIKTRRVRWLGYVACMKKVWNSFQSWLAALHGRVNVGGLVLLNWGDTEMICCHMWSNSVLMCNFNSNFDAMCQVAWGFDLWTGKTALGGPEHVYLTYFMMYSISEVCRSNYWWAYLHTFLCGLLYDVESVQTVRGLINDGLERIQVENCCGLMEVLYQN